MATIVLNEEDRMTVTAALGYAVEKYTECREVMREAGGQYLQVADTFEKQRLRADHLRRVLDNCEDVSLEVS